MIELTTDGMAHGGAAVGRIDGKAHFVEGALPGETIAGTIAHDAGSWARVDIKRVVSAAADRVDPPCRHDAECGGCQWQFSTRDAQLGWKRSIVEGQLAHIGGLSDVDVRHTASPGPAFGYRNRMDFKVVDGSPALHRRRSKELVALDECLVIHPLLRDMFDRLGDLAGVRSVTLRAGITTGQKLAVVVGGVPDQAGDWDCGVAQRSRSGLRTVVGAGAIHEEVAGATFRITGTTFFQNNTQGAETLVELVTEALDPRPGDVLVDAYAGGGLFAATVGKRCGEVITIEVSPGAIGDLRHNLEEAGVHGTVVQGDAGDEIGDLGIAVDLVVVNPPRTGLRSEGVEAILDAGPRVVAYVSCDPASFARDAKQLVSGGYELEWIAPVDMFPQTYHIEAVARLVRSDL